MVLRLRQHAAAKDKERKGDSSHERFARSAVWLALLTVVCAGVQIRFASAQDSGTRRRAAVSDTGSEFTSGVVPAQNREAIGLPPPMASSAAATACRRIGKREPA